jgi:hypothetical protein
MILCAAFGVTEAHGQDGQRPTYPLPVCTHVEQAQCTAVLTNTWDGRQVVHQLGPVPVCTSRGGLVLQDRVERKNRTIAQLRDKVARLRGRLDP